MKLPERKQVRLKDFDYSTNGKYFITICTQDKKKVLSEIAWDGIHDVPHIVLLPCGEIVDKYIHVMNERFEGATVEKYIIMPNHIHLIIEVENGGGMSQAPSPTNAVIPKFVSLLKRYCSRELGGNIFQRSYHDHIIRDEQDYLKIWTYVDSNHQKWEDDVFFL
ncbi:MAG: transposase [Clostridia bacterium]|nr:transposase [Clostridia bacterium]MBR5266048.1 transposase [Clostridia bacterium]